MSLDNPFLIAVGSFLVVGYFLLSILEKITNLRRSSQRQPSLEQELRTMLEKQEERLICTVKGLIPNVTVLEERFKREIDLKQHEIDRAEERSRRELMEFRSRYEKVIPEMYDLIRMTNSTISKTATDFMAMVSRIEGAFDMHVKIEQQKGPKE
jgi:hypothetical protein